VRLNNGGNPGLCWEADLNTLLANDIGQWKAKTP